jgi:ATP-binding protein involved in chromosome partitioning
MMASFETNAVSLHWVAVTRDQIIEALRPVEDPELHRSIVELDMVRDIAIDGPSVSVLIALTVAGCPLKAEITSRATNAVEVIDGVDSVAIEFTVMTPDELAALKKRLGAGASQINSTPVIDERARILAISSGKGGVGKSSVTVNLGVALAAVGYKVGILDADVYGFSIPQMLGVTTEPEINDAGKIIPPVTNGVKAVSIGFFVEDDKPVMWRGPMLHKALEQFFTDVVWGELDFLLIDMPPGTGDVAMSLAKQVPHAETYVVTTPQPAAQRVARRSGAMAMEVGSPVAGVIENMSWLDNGGQRIEVFGSGGGASLAESLNTELVGRLPLEPALREGGDCGRPVVVWHPESEVAKVFVEMAQRIVETAPRRRYRKELQVK